jgi:hypothetical protein
MSENFTCQYLRYLKRSLTCRKVLGHGTLGFTSNPKEGVLFTDASNQELDLKVV